MNIEVFKYKEKTYTLIELLEVNGIVFAICQDATNRYNYFKVTKISYKNAYVPFAELISVLPEYNTITHKNISHLLEALIALANERKKLLNEILDKTLTVIRNEKVYIENGTNLELSKEYFEAKIKTEFNDYRKRSVNELLQLEVDAIKEIKKEVPTRKFPLGKFAYMMLIVISVVGFMECYSAFSEWKQEGIDSKKLMSNILDDTEITEEYVELDIEDIYNVAEDSKTPTGVNKGKYSADYYDYMKIAMMNVDFTKLIKENSDTAGWLYVNNTNINYPFVQGKDNTYYLTHAFNRNKSAVGWLFADYRSDLKSFKRNTVIYGHGRVDQVMFGSLENILKKSWYTNTDNHIIKLSTPTQNTLWQVFSVYTVEAESYYLTHNFENDESYDKFLKTIESRSKYDFGVELDVNDKVLTLSTCLNYNGERIVLHAKLVKVQDK